MRIAFSPRPGINSDDTDFSGTGGWVDGSNVRFWQGKPQAIGGYADALEGETLTGVCRNLFSWTTSGGIRLTAFGAHNALQLYTEGSLYDITPAGLAVGAIDSAGYGPGWGSGEWSEGTWGSAASAYYTRTWSLDAYGEYLAACPRGGTLYVWEGDVAVDAAAVANAPDEITYILVTPERQVLALGCNEETSGDFNPLCIRGSDIEDYTDWTTSSSNNAFEHILEGAGRIVAGRLLGAYVAIWTDAAFYLGQFIGAPGQTYRFDRIADQCGLIGPNAVHITARGAYWVGTEGSVFFYALGGLPQQLPCPIGQEFIANLEIDQKEKVCAGGVSQFGEVWFHYPDRRDGIENSRYIAIGVQEGSGWFRGILARTAMQDAAIAPYPLMVTYGGTVYQHEDPEGTVPDAYVESADQHIDEGGRRTMITRMVPDFQGQTGDLSLTLNVRDWPQSAKTAKGPYTLTTSTRKKDFRASGRILSVKLSSSNVAWRMGKPIFEGVAMGER